MAYAGSGPRFRQGIGLVLAAIVAPVATTFLFMLATIGTGVGPLWLGNGLDLVQVFLFVGLFAALYGFLGAFLFLGVAFWLACRTGAVGYVWAGAGAGLAHSLVGLLLRMATDSSGALGRGSEFLGDVIWWGGFLLTATPYGPHPNIIIACAALAGALAGWVFSRFARAID